MRPWRQVPAQAPHPAQRAGSIRIAPPARSIASLKQTSAQGAGQPAHSRAAGTVGLGIRNRTSIARGIQ
jgi:hypothetical protein